MVIHRQIGSGEVQSVEFRIAKQKGRWIRFYFSFVSDYVFHILSPNVSGLHHLLHRIGGRLFGEEFAQQRKANNLSPKRPPASPEDLEILGACLAKLCEPWRQCEHRTTFLDFEECTAMRWCLVDETPTMKAPAALERLRVEGYTGGITLVRDYLRLVRLEVLSLGFQSLPTAIVGWLELLNENPHIGTVILNWGYCHYTFTASAQRYRDVTLTLPDGRFWTDYDLGRVINELRQLEGHVEQITLLGGPVPIRKAVRRLKGGTLG